MAYPNDTGRDEITRLGNWNDVVDENGDGSIIAILKAFNVDFNSSILPPVPEVYERTLRNRIGNFTDAVDSDCNGSLLAQIKLALSSIKALVLVAGPRNLHSVLAADPASYTVQSGDVVIRVDCTTQAKTVVFNPNSAPLQETSIYREAGNFPLTITDGTNVLGVINDTGLVLRFQDVIDSIKQISG